jgi:hypothetical protein
MQGNMFEARFDFGGIINMLGELKLKENSWDPQFSGKIYVEGK